MFRNRNLFLSLAAGATLASLGFVFGTSKLATAQELSPIGGVFLSEDGRLISGPSNAIDLSDLIRERGGAIDLNDLHGMISRSSKDGFVTGQIYFAGGLKTGQSMLSRERAFDDALPIPMINVTLRPTDRQTVEFGPYKTTQAGVFVSQKVAAGEYVLCASGDGWEEHCRELKVGNGRKHLEPFNLRPQTGQDFATVVGHVELADGGFPLADVPYANILKAAKVTAFAPNGTVLREVYVNTLGDYILPALPAGDRTRVVVTMEGTSRVDNIPPLTLPMGGRLRRDIVLDNSRPIVSNPVVRLNGVDAYTVPLGETVNIDMSVDDPDGDTPEIKWFIADGNGALSADDIANPNWTLPKAPGPYQAVAVVSDGKGGVRIKRLRVTASDLGERFTGRVTDTSGTPVANVEVDVNGDITTTNASGQFELQTKVNDRYVLNIRSTAHALLSQVYGKPSQGGEYQLVRATQKKFDPRNDIVLQDKRDQSECRGAPSASLNWKVPSQRRHAIRLGEKGREQQQGRQFDFVDLPASVSPQRKRRHDCGPGATVRIPANSLVDANGNPPTGMVTVSISTYDIEAAMEMPGDYSVALEGTDEVISGMESYGAAFVDVRAGATEYNLASGSVAEINIPVAQAQLAIGAPIDPIIPIFHYDEDRGVWNKTGQAELTPNGFTTKVAHFSAINADVEKQQPACIHIETDTSNGIIPDQFQLEYTIVSAPGSGAAPIVRTGSIDAASSDDHVIYNLPENRDVVIVPFDPATDTPYATFVVNSGAPHGSNTNPPDHTLCSNTAQVFIPDVPRQLPAGVEYLQGLFSFFAYDLSGNPGTYADDLLEASQDYYATVDPLVNRRDTFGQFKSIWGFDGTEANARYANSADLGFGRDMHCTSSDIDNDGTDEVACYVSNYGFREDDDQDNANWAGSQDETRYVATVAMEYAPVESPGTEASPTFTGGDIVKFFVYGRDADPSVDSDGDGLALDHDEGTLVTDADLDGYGNRPIPQLCMVCHGGTLPNSVNQDSDGNPTPGPLPVFSSAADVDLGSRFLPFDLDSYTFPNAGPVIGTQEAAFKTLNQDFVAQTELSAAIQELLDEFYAPGGTAAAQNRQFAVSGWSGTAAETEMYRHVVGPNCRICHVAHDNIAPSLQFRNATDLNPNFAKFVACDQRYMPHAVRTYERLWTSLNPHQPGQMANWLADNGVDPSSCIFPPNNGQTFELP